MHFILIKFPGTNNNRCRLNFNSPEWLLGDMIFNKNFIKCSNACHRFDKNCKLPQLFPSGLIIFLCISFSRVLHRMNGYKSNVVNQMGTKTHWRLWVWVMCETIGKWCSAQSVERGMTFALTAVKSTQTIVCVWCSWHRCFHWPWLEFIIKRRWWWIHFLFFLTLHLKRLNAHKLL